MFDFSCVNHTKKGSVVSNLDKLLEQARNHQMTDAERERQRISFAYGNLKLSNPKTTKGGVVRAAEKLK